MSLDTYDGLVAEVQDWLFGRSDIAAKAPTFIRMLEAKANRKLMVRQMETRARATVDIGSDEPEFISLPGDFQTMRRVRLPAETGKPRLEFKTSAQLDELRDSNSDRTGTPQCFTVAGDEMELWPTPSTAIEIEMTYRCNLPALGKRADELALGPRTGRLSLWRAHGSGALSARRRANCDVGEWPARRIRRPREAL
jgi:hypothetical protein